MLHLRFSCRLSQTGSPLTTSNFPFLSLLLVLVLGFYIIFCFFYQWVGGGLSTTHTYCSPEVDPYLVFFWHLGVEDKRGFEWESGCGSENRGGGIVE